MVANHKTPMTVTVYLLVWQIPEIGKSYALTKDGDWIDWGHICGVYDWDEVMLFDPKDHEGTAQIIETLQGDSPDKTFVLAAREIPFELFLRVTATHDWIHSFLDAFEKRINLEGHAKRIGKRIRVERMKGQRQPNSGYRKKWFSTHFMHARRELKIANGEESPLALETIRIVDQISV